MTSLDCSCGYEADTPTDLVDHLGEVFIPLSDDIGTDGHPTMINPAYELLT